MALRAGYYGIKRGIKDKLAQIAGSWDATVATIFPRSEQLILGSKNILPNAALTDEVNNAIFTVSDNKIITVNGTVNAATTFSLCTFRLKAGNYIFSGFPGTGTFNDLVQLGLKENNISGSDIASMTNTSRGEKIFNLPQETTVFAFIYARSGVAFTNNVFRPMIRLASDPNSTYAAPALTNIDLTLSAAEQKTTINAIITAATGAADFAAFKAAMEAITPVTRSSTAATPEEIVKDEIEEPVVEKKTTTRKKSTAKADTKEEV